MGIFNPSRTGVGPAKTGGWDGISKGFRGIPVTASPVADPPSSPRGGGRGNNRGGKQTSPLVQPARGVGFRPNSTPSQSDLDSQERNAARNRANREGLARQPRPYGSPEIKVPVREPVAKPLKPVGVKPGVPSVAGGLGSVLPDLAGEAWDFVPETSDPFAGLIAPNLVGFKVEPLTYSGQEPVRIEFHFKAVNEATLFLLDGLTGTEVFRQKYEANFITNEVREIYNFVPDRDNLIVKITGKIYNVVRGSLKRIRRSEKDNPTEPLPYKYSCLPGNLRPDPLLIPAVLLNTESGRLSKIYSDVEYELKASIKINLATGSEEFSEVNLGTGFFAPNNDYYLNWPGLGYTSHPTLLDGTEREVQFDGTWTGTSCKYEPPEITDFVPSGITDAATQAAVDVFFRVIRTGKNRLVSGVISNLGWLTFVVNNLSNFYNEDNGYHYTSLESIILSNVEVSPVVDLNPILNKLDQLDTKVGNLNSKVVQVDTKVADLSEVIGPKPRMGAANGSSNGGTRKSISEFLESVKQNKKTQELINLLTLLVALHNAAMLSSDVVVTLLSVIDIGLELSGLTPKDDDGSPLLVSEVIGQNVKSLLNQLLGKELVSAVNEVWLKANKTYQSASNVINAVQSHAYTIQSGLETIASNNSKANNAFVRDGVLREESLDYQPEKYDFSNKLFTRIEKTSDLVNKLSYAAQEVKSIKQTVEEFKTLKKDLDDTIKEAEKQLKKIITNNKGVNKPTKIPNSAGFNQVRGEKPFKESP